MTSPERICFRFRFSFGILDRKRKIKNPPLSLGRPSPPRRTGNGPGVRDHCDFLERDMMVMTLNLMAAELTWLPNLSQSDMRTSHLSAPLMANSAKAEPMKLAFGARPVWFWVFWRRKYEAKKILVKMAVIHQ